MKRITFITILMLAAALAQAQNTPTTAQDDMSDVEIFCEEPPMFPGGEEALLSYLSSNIHYPKKARRHHIEGRVYVQYVVEKDGSISNVAVKRDIGYGCGDEVARVVSNMPRWTPAKQHGEAVRYIFTQAIDFRLPDKPSKAKSKSLSRRKSN